MFLTPKIFGVSYTNSRLVMKVLVFAFLLMKVLAIAMLLVKVLVIAMLLMETLVIAMRLMKVIIKRILHNYGQIIVS